MNRGGPTAWRGDWKPRPGWDGRERTTLDAVRITLELDRSPSGRLEGTALLETGAEHRFSGTLDLLRILEGLRPAGLPCSSPSARPEDPR